MSRKSPTQLKKIYKTSLIVSVSVFILAILAPLQAVRAAGSASMTISPSTGSFTVGNTITLTISVDSGSELINAVQADLTYDKTRLEYVNAKINVGPFSSGPSPVGGNGTVQIVGGAITPQSGSKTFATVSFKALSASSYSSIQIASTSAIVRASDTANVWDETKNSANFVLLGNSNTRLAWSSENLTGGSVSMFPTTQTVGLASSSAFFNNELYVAYYNASEKTLELAKSTNAGWVRETIDGKGGADGRIIADVGRYTAMVADGTLLHIYYYDQTNGNLRYAQYNATNSSWTFSILDGATNDPETNQYNHNVGEYVAATTYIDQYSRQHVFYYDRTLGNLRHGWNAPGIGWRFENLEGDFGSISRYDSNIGIDISTLQYGNSLQLFYYDLQRGNLRHTWFTPGIGWRFENLEGDFGSISRYNSDIGSDTTAVVYGNSLQLFYYDRTLGNLRHCWNAPGIGWRFENLEGDFGSISRYNSDIGSDTTAVVYQNGLHVYYRDRQAGLLRGAVADERGWTFATVEGNPWSVTGHASNTGFEPNVTIFNNTMHLFVFDNDQRSLRHLWGVNRY